MAKTYRRGTTVNRGGRTHYRRGGSVRYQPAAGGGDGVLAVFRAAAVGISRPVLKAVHKVSDLPGRKARLERDKALITLMSERSELRAKLNKVDDTAWFEESEESLQDRLEGAGVLTASITDDVASVEFEHDDTGEIYSAAAPTLQEALAKVSSEVFTEQERLRIRRRIWEIDQVWRAQRLPEQ